jgi:hypothetical protein
LPEVDRLEFLENSAFRTPMRVQIRFRIVTDDDAVLSEGEIACFDKGDDQLEAIDLSLDEAKVALSAAP